MKKKKQFIFLLIAFSVVLVDQILKFILVKRILPIPYTTNTGAGFGLFQDTAPLLIWISIIVLGLILFYYDKINKEKLLNISAALLFGGTIGNLIDRIRLGYVIDFIDLKIWPSFNIADAAITIGGIGIIYYLIKKK